MKIGLISDLHLGYSHGSKVITGGPMDGVNVREGDFIFAANDAIENLLSKNVDVIIDGGDIAHVAAPKKRAISELISLISKCGVPFYSVDGNHTSLKSTSDIHLYDILSQECSNFYGYKEPGITPNGIAMIPHSYDAEVLKISIEKTIQNKPLMMVGHFAASDIEFDSSKVPIEYLPTDIPIFLGHYHKHKKGLWGPTYIGSTERTAWDQWDFPTGSIVYDLEDESMEYVPHKTRPFVNLLATGEDYLDIIDGEDLENAIVRLTITARREEYGTLNFREAKRKAFAAGALQYHHRRAKDAKDEETFSVETQEDISIVESWAKHMKKARVPKGVNRKDIERLGIEALNG